MLHGSRFAALARRECVGRGGKVHGETCVIYGPFGRVASLRPGNNLVPHAHTDAHIVVPVAGPCSEAIIGTQHVFLGEGTGVAVNPLTIHSFQLRDCNDSVSMLTFYINPQWLSRLYGVSPSAPFRVATICLDSNMRDTARALAASIELGTSSESALVEETTAFLETLVALATSPAGHYRPIAALLRPDFRVRRAMDFMRQNLDARVTLEQVARSAGLSRPHFFSLFHEQTVLTPRIYWNLLRIENAVNQIGAPQNQISDLAYNLGFSSQGNFSRFFREHIGVSPICFRKAVRQAEAPQ
jgi:AraC family transcriptional regulator